jgi:hypothetical protein
MRAPPETGARVNAEFFLEAGAKVRIQVPEIQVESEFRVPNCKRRAIIHCAAPGTRKAVAALQVPAGDLETERIRQVYFALTLQFGLTSALPL